jgi:uncharacterized protein with HEPN domain
VSQTRDPGQRLADVLDAVTAIRAHLTVGDVEDPLVFDAVRMRLIEIGEAAKSLPEEILALEPSIPWRAICRMRDILTHHYFATLKEEVHSAITHDLDPLERAVNNLVQRTQELSAT